MKTKMFTTKESLVEYVNEIGEHGHMVDIFKIEDELYKVVVFEKQNKQTSNPNKKNNWHQIKPKVIGTGTQHFLVVDRMNKQSPESQAHVNPTSKGIKPKQQIISIGIPNWK